MGTFFPINFPPYIKECTHFVRIKSSNRTPVFYKEHGREGLNTEPCILTEPYQATVRRSRFNLYDALQSSKIAILGFLMRVFIRCPYVSQLLLCSIFEHFEHFEDFSDWSIDTLKNRKKLILNSFLRLFTAYYGFLRGT